MNLSGLVSGVKPPVCVSAPVWNYQGLIRVETPEEEMITMLFFESVAPNGRASAVLKTLDAHEVDGSIPS